MKPMLIFMGGGYAKPIEDTVDAFCDLFLEDLGRNTASYSESDLILPDIVFSSQ